MQIWKLDFQTDFIVKTFNIVLSIDWNFNNLPPFYFFAEMHG